MLRQTIYCDIRTTIFGETYDSPLLVSPVGVQTIFHEDRELSVAEIAAELGMPYIVSTAASPPTEEVA